MSFEPVCDKFNNLGITPSIDSDQPGHLPNLISLSFVLKG